MERGCSDGVDLVADFVSTKELLRRSISLEKVRWQGYRRGKEKIKPFEIPFSQSGAGVAGVGVNQM